VILGGSKCKSAYLGHVLFIISERIAGCLFLHYFCNQKNCFKFHLKALLHRSNGPTLRDAILSAVWWLQCCKYLHLFLTNIASLRLLACPASDRFSVHLPGKGARFAECGVQNRRSPCMYLLVSLMYDADGQSVVNCCLPVTGGLELCYVWWWIPAIKNHVF
jgi:hypothetical protein